eukprot:gene12271-biopygen2409
MGLLEPTRRRTVPHGGTRRRTWRTPPHGAARHFTRRRTALRVKFFPEAVWSVMLFGSVFGGGGAPSRRIP